MFENVTLQGIAGSPLGSTSTAVLWLISPRQYSPQYKRPLTYNFDGRFIEAADIAVAKMAEQQNSTGIKAVIGSPHLMGSIYPSASGHMVHMHQLAMNWTFMLVINNDKTGPGGVMRAMSDNQHLYYGYFVNEPFNPVSHGGRQTPNPNAMMIVTHKTLVNKSSTFGAYGQKSRPDLAADIDVIHPQILDSLTTGHTSLIRPEDLYPIVDDTMMGETTVMLAESALLERQENPVQIRSKLSMPRDNVDKILSAVATTKSAMNASIGAGESGVLGLGRDTYREQIEYHLKDGAHLTEMGLPTDRVILLGTVLERYNPQIPEPRRQDFNPRYTPIDQTVASARNIFSSMLTTIVPALMSSFMLIEIAFEYDSHTGALQLSDHTPPASIVPMDQTHLQFQISGFTHRLVNEILAIIKQRGDFYLQMQCSTIGVTHVSLNFYDDYTRSKEVFEVPTIFGGLTSSLVATTDVVDHNAKQLHGLISQLVETHTDGPPLGFYDASRFGQNLLAYDRASGQGSGQDTNPPPQSNRWQL